jgi:light-regulated signal transduction histidine kinase (bacteriophytochrome)
MTIMLTAADLSSCDREPIHVPGSIQPHGLMLIADPNGLYVRHVAGWVERRLGTSDWADQPLSALIGKTLHGRIKDLIDEGRVDGFVGELEAPSGETLSVSAYMSAPHVVVELETAFVDHQPAALMMDRLAAAAAGFERTASLTSLCEEAAAEFRHLTGFDRVMIYRFLADGTGTVLAEDKRAGLHSYLNQHFPASDIPVQARALYLRNLSRAIPDASYQAAAIRPSWTSSEPLDMSAGSLRSVSPVHLRYLANMGVKASASFSIVKDGALWGLIACHHETTRFLPCDVRSTCCLLAGSLGQQIKAKEAAAAYRQRIRLRSFEDDIVALLSRESLLEEPPPHHLEEIGRMMGGTGVAVLRGHDLVLHGVCPSEAEVRALITWLPRGTADQVFSTDQLSRLYPAAEAYQAMGSGVLAIILSVDEPWVLLWFRAEQLQTVSWAGNPHKAAGADPAEPLTPRASFSAWSETVRGTSRGWSLPEIDAAGRLRSALLDAQKNRRMHELNRQLTKILQDKDLLLEQKQFLIGEVNHRVQNSLQLVSSFLALQARASDNPELHTALEEAGRRLTAVAIVHRRLYRGDQIGMVDAARYIEELCADTFSYMGQDWAQHLSLSLSPVLISTDRAITLGLVITELMININKYAYGGAPGPVDIELVEDLTHLHLALSDRGVGKATSSSGFGSRIIVGLMEQLGGALSFSDNKPGLRATITIPLQDTRQAPVATLA